MKRSSPLIVLTATLLLSANVWAAPLQPTVGDEQPAAGYRVKKGDRLYAIARRNGLSVTELKRLNGLQSDTIKPGQELLLAADGSSEPTPAVAIAPSPTELLCQDSAATTAGELVALETGLAVLGKAAFSYLSTPYRFGGSNHRGIDCSSFVRNVFRELTIDLPRTAREQYRLGASIEPTDLQSGDLLFFRTYAKYPSHVGIYLGDHKMIHASPRSRRVVIASIDSPYFRSRFIGARRLARFGGSLDVAVFPQDVEEDAEGFLEETGEPAITAGGQGRRGADAEEQDSQSIETGGKPPLPRDPS